MICKNCGSQIEDYSAFCTNCGSAVEAQPQPQPQEYAPVNDYYAQPQEQAPVNEIYPQPAEPEANYGTAPYDASSYQTAKEYIAGAKKSMILSIVSVSAYFGLPIISFALGLLSLIPIIGIVFMVLSFPVGVFCGTGTLICAIVSAVKLGKLNKLSEVTPGRIDPQFFANYQKGQKNAKTAKILNIIRFVMAGISVLLTVGIIVLLVILLISGGLEDFIEEIFYFVDDIYEDIFGYGSYYYY